MSEYNINDNAFDLKKEIYNLKKDLNALMKLSGELVSIVDKNGVFININTAYSELMNIKKEDILGKSVFTFQEDGMFSSSAAAEVLKNKKVVTLTQTTKTGKRLIVRGHPILNDDNEIERVINIAKDVTLEDKLKDSLEETKGLVHYYQTELNKLSKGNSKIIVRSQSMQNNYDLIYKVANSQATVMLLGESGVGKGIIAKEIHNNSPRSRGPFVTINCGAIPESLIESELFGYAKGTFTGGSQEGKQGLIRSANKGTLFLDEIAELPLNLQVKILNVLQERKVTPLGQSKSYDVDLRFVAATNQNLEKMVNNGAFRKDLYYRLNVIPVNIPPLRERQDEIPFLIDFFLNEFNNKYNHIKTIDSKVINFFIKKEWKGNIRELENTIERLIITTTNNHITLDDLPYDVKKSPLYVLDESNKSLKTMLEEKERDIIFNVLKSSRTMKEASIKLGVNVSTISRKVKKYHLNF